ncbi:MAG: hypothetical protein Q9217_004327 [Psora testacea]
MYKYTTITGYFLQDELDTEPSTFDYTKADLGLINRAYPIDASFNPSDGITQWQLLAHHIRTLIDESPDSVQYKLIYMGRHGQGVHNVAEGYYGRPAWDAHWSKLDGNGTVTWADAPITEVGIAQAQVASTSWSSLITQGIPLPESYYVSPLDRCLATAKHTFSNLSLPAARPFKPMVKEMLRECIGVHTCDRRSSLTYIRQGYPDYDIEAGFSEDDELYSAERRETDEEMDVRIRGFLDDIFEHDEGTFLSFTTHSETLVTISPSSNKPILTRNGLSDADIALLPAISTQAFNSYRSTSLEQRQAIVRKALQLIEARKDVLARELTEQMGRPIAYTAKEITTAVARGEYLLKISGDCLKDTDGEPERGFRRYIRKCPLGPVLILFAWNYPYLILVNSLIPALLAGNTVIIKPSPQTPTIAEQIHDIFLEAGLPEKAIQYFHCGSISRLESVVRVPQIKLICFTGSVAAGIQVQRAAADRVVPVALELGGKDPAYVREDVDVKWAAEEIVDGAVFNSGQSCCSLERIYVAEKIHDEFVAAMQEVLRSYKLGDPLDPSSNVGPVVSRQSATRIAAHINDAIEKGAKDATPENASFANPPKEGNFIKPTLLTEVTHDMTVMNEETFGPVIPVMRVGDDEEAVRMMNDSEFGLTASIWTKDMRKGEELADLVEAGTCFVNRCDYPSPDLAWTGWKNSGKGVSLSKFGFEQYVKLKSLHVKEYPK